MATRREQSPSRSIDLDKHFRPDSAARTIAERLLTGKPMTRNQLVDGLDVSVTTVNRVVQALERAGAHIERTVAPDGRQARFHVRHVGKPRRKVTFPALAAPVTITGAHLSGTSAVVDFEAAREKYRGTSPLRSVPPLGGTAKVSALEDADEETGTAVVKLTLKDGKTVRLDGVQNTTPD